MLVDPQTIPEIKTTEESGDNGDSDWKSSWITSQKKSTKNILNGMGDAEMMSEVRQTLKSSNGNRLKMQRQISNQPKEMRKDPASNAFRALKLHALCTEEEFTKPERPKNTDDFLYQMAKQVHYE